MVDKFHYDENRAIRRIRDVILHDGPKLHDSNSMFVLRGHVTGDKHCPDNPIYAVPLWYLFGLSENPTSNYEDDIEQAIPDYDPQVRDAFYKMLCHVSVVFTDGDYILVNGNSAHGLFRRSEDGSDAIRRFLTDSIIAVPYEEVADATSVAVSTLSHEIRHAFDTLTKHWSVDSSYTSYHENAEAYFKNPQEIRARVTELAHQAEDVIHDLVDNLNDAEYGAGALRVLTEIFGSGAAVFGSWLFGLLTPFHKGVVSIDGDPILPRPTLDLGLLQTMLKITAGAYAKNQNKETAKEQKLIQDWMAAYTKSLYNALVSMYKTKLPASVFHNDKAKTQQLWDLAYRNLAELHKELPNFTW